MVKIETVTVFVCAYCGERHKKWEQAVDCECRESPETEEEDTFVCEVCGNKFKREEDAEDCESKCKEIQRQEAEEQERLLRTANHPSQRRLG